jgi:hypothetical protein
MFTTLTGESRIKLHPHFHRFSHIFLHLVHLPNVSASLEQCFHSELVTVMSSIHKRRVAILSHREGRDGNRS